MNDDDFPLPPANRVPSDCAQTSTRYYSEADVRAHRRAYAAHLLAALEVASKDAQRYRWLRSGERMRQGTALPDTGTRIISKDEKQALLSFNYWCSQNELDAAIDAASTGETHV